MDVKQIVAGLSQDEIKQLKDLVLAKDAKRKAKEASKKISSKDKKAFLDAKKAVRKLVNTNLEYTSQLPVNVGFGINSRGKAISRAYVHENEVKVFDHKIEKIKKEIEVAFAEYSRVAKYIRNKYRIGNYEIAQQTRSYGAQIRSGNFLYY